MNRLEETISVSGHQIQRYLYEPPTAPRGSVLLFHGQGDFVTRYEEVIAVFLEHGLVVISADLPGHGHSPGRRGHVPGFDFIDALIDTLTAHLSDLALPKFRGVAGHSCGGLLALHTLLRSPNDWEFAWLSSPLIKPEASQTATRVGLFRLASHLAPWLSVSTGVSLDACLSPDSDGTASAREQLDDKESYFHSRITLSWARKIKERAEKIRKEFAESPPEIPLLLTQGADDRVCPPKILKALVETTDLESIQYREFSGLRHEPFADANREVVLEALSLFLRETLNQTTSPSG